MRNGLNYTSLPGTRLIPYLGSDETDRYLEMLCIIMIYTRQLQTLLIGEIIGRM